MNIELYTRPNCSRCEAVKDALASRQIPYTEHIIGETILREKVLDQFPGVTLLPVVTIDGTWIGGRDEILLKLANDEI